MVRDVAWLIASIAWSLSGLAVGFILGRLYCEIHDVRDALMAEVESHHGGHHLEHLNDALVDEERRVSPDRRQHRSSRLNAGLGLVVVLLAVGSVTLVAVQASQQQARNECQSDYNDTFEQVLNERTRAASADRAANTTLVQENIAIAALNLPLSESRPRQRLALQAYLNALNASDAVRARNPIPTRPKCKV